jgi:hypothetical protein
VIRGNTIAAATTYVGDLHLHQIGRAEANSYLEALAGILIDQVVGDDARAATFRAEKVYVL